jgi:acyl carrier protein
MVVTAQDILKLFDDVEIPVPTVQLSETAPLSTQGLDSLDLAMLFRHIESTYSVTLPPGRLKSLSDITEFLNQAASSTAASG